MNLNKWNFIFVYLGSLRIVLTTSSSSPIVLLWWNSLIRDGSIRSESVDCGSEFACLITNDRDFYYNGSTSALIFYGTDMTHDDLPLPRAHWPPWALIHEESPQNSWLLVHSGLSLVFNYTSTFQRGSDFPLTLGYLPSEEYLLESKWMLSVEEKNKIIKEKDLAPVIYVQSDCTTSSDRDQLVKQLMKYIPIDSYGLCLTNKKIPDSLSNPMDTFESDEFLQFLSQYKFILSFENSICDDYITEKVWRSFHVGAIPIILSSPTIKDWLPHPTSSILVQDFSTVDQLANHILGINSNDSAYAEHLTYKATGINNTFLREQLNSKKDLTLKTRQTHLFDQFQCQLGHWVSNLANSNTASISTSHNFTCPSPFALASNGTLVWNETYRLNYPDYTWDWERGKVAAEQFIRKVQVRTNDHSLKDEL